MTPEEFYRLKGPTKWAGPPERWSFSTLQAVERCPLQWQLVRSQYGSLERYPERPNEAAEVGDLVHRLLNKLLVAMASQGMPAVGSPDFAKVIAEISPIQWITRELETVQKRLQGHPRASLYQIKSTPRDIYNEAAQLFRREYALLSPSKERRASQPNQSVEQKQENILERLKRRGVLSEQEVYHPSIPIWGIIDIVERLNGSTVIADFKTGAKKEIHLDQVKLYALLWWRTTQDLPTTVEIRYNKESVVSAITETELVSIENSISQKIIKLSTQLQAPNTVAQPGEHCKYCNVKQFCEIYWNKEISQNSLWVDIEVAVSDEITPTGFTAKTNTDKEIKVIYSENIQLHNQPTLPFKKIRILGAKRNNDDIEVTKTTEIFYLE